MRETSVEPLFTDDVLARLRRVVLHSRRLSKSGLVGEHRSLRKGHSPEFSDFKAYSVGDDYRRIDWRAFARFDELYVRESEITTEFDVHILVDVSHSMNWTSSESTPTKLRQALRLTGALGYLALWHFDRVTVSPVGSDAERRFGPAQGRSHTPQLLSWLERLHAQSETALAPAFRRIIHERRRPGLMLVVSDFLSEDLEVFEDAMRRAVSRGWEVALFQIHDPAEADPTLLPDLATTHQVTDLETGARMPVRVDPASLASYHERRNAWQSELARLAEGHRTRYIPIDTTIPVDQAMIRLLRSVGMVT